MAGSREGRDSREESSAPGLLAAPGAAQPLTYFFRSPASARIPGAGARLGPGPRWEQGSLSWPVSLWSRTMEGGQEARLTAAPSVNLLSLLLSCSLVLSVFFFI